MLVSEALRNWLIENDYAQKSWSGDSDILWKGAAQQAIDDGKLSAEKLAELQASKKSPTAKDVFGGNVRVKRASERYSNAKSAAMHAKSGLTVRDEKGCDVQTTSQLEHAKAGAFLKKLAQRAGLGVVLNEHENALLQECFEGEWCGDFNGQHRDAIDGMQVKTLLDDNTSGGLNLVPNFWDTNVVTYPLVHSELLPRIDLQNLTRGSTVETAAISNPTVTWGTAEGSALTPFTTTSLVSSITGDVFPVAVAIEIGRDFMSDSVVDIGRILTENIGQRLLAELDKVIVSGDGTTQPQGLFTASSTVDIGTPVGGNGAPPQVNDYEALMFGIGKQYRTAAMRPAFIGNDTSYRRSRAIPVGAADVRRVFGMDESSYMLLDHPFLIQNDLANTKAGFAALAKYRLWRRAGQEVSFTKEGRTLALTNTALLTVRGRYAGKLLDANAFAFSDNWQS